MNLTAFRALRYGGSAKASGGGDPVQTGEGERDVHVQRSLSQLDKNLRRRSTRRARADVEIALADAEPAPVCMTPAARRTTASTTVCRSFVLHGSAAGGPTRATQLHYARKAITPEMEFVAIREGLPAEFVRDEVARGRAIIRPTSIMSSSSR